MHDKVVRKLPLRTTRLIAVLVLRLSVGLRNSPLETSILIAVLALRLSVDLKNFLLTG